MEYSDFSGVLATLVAGIVAWRIASKSLDLQKKEYQYTKIYEPLINDLIGMKNIDLGDFGDTDSKMKIGALYQYFIKCENDFYKKIHNQDVDIYIGNIRGYFDELLNIEDAIGENFRASITNAIIKNAFFQKNGFSINSLFIPRSKTQYDFISYKYDPTKKLVFQLMRKDVKRDIRKEISNSLFFAGDKTIELNAILGSAEQENGMYTEIIDNLLDNGSNELENRFAEFTENRQQFLAAIQALMDQLEQDYILKIK